MDYYVQAYNHSDYLIREERLLNMKRRGLMIKYQAKPSELSYICVSQQYRQHMIIDTEWGGLWWKNSPFNVFTRLDHYFQLKLDGTSFL